MQTKLGMRRLRRSVNQACVVSFIVLAAFSGTEAIAEQADVAKLSALNDGSSNGISYRYRVVDSRSGRTQLDADVVVSEYGLTAEDKMSEGVLGYILNFDADTAWMINKRNRLYHQIPLVFKASEAIDEIEVAPESLVSGDEEEASISLPETPLVSAIPYDRACSNLAAKPRQPVMRDGELLDVWECRDKKNMFVRLDAYSKRDEHVVISVSASGVVERWDAFEHLAQSQREWFSPGENYSEVSFEEFVNGRPALDEYVPETEIQLE